MVPPTFFFSHVLGTPEKVPTDVNTFIMNRVSSNLYPFRLKIHLIWQQPQTILKAVACPQLINHPEFNSFDFSTYILFNLLPLSFSLLLTFFKVILKKFSVSLHIIKVYYSFIRKYIQHIGHKVTASPSFHISGVYLLWIHSYLSEFLQTWILALWLNLMYPCLNHINNKQDYINTNAFSHLFSISFGLVYVRKHN